MHVRKWFTCIFLIHFIGTHSVVPKLCSVGAQTVECNRSNQKFCLNVDSLINNKVAGRRITRLLPVSLGANDGILSCKWNKAAHLNLEFKIKSSFTQVIISSCLYIVCKNIKTVRTLQMKEWYSHYLLCLRCLIFFKRKENKEKMAHSIWHL